MIAATNRICRQKLFGRAIILNCHPELQFFEAVLVIGNSREKHKEHERGGSMQSGGVNRLCDVVRETSYAIHRFHRCGHLEKIYENALVHRLRKLGLEVRQQHPLAVYDEDGTPLGEFFADLLVEGKIIVELKASRSVLEEHVAQLLGYLKSARIETGLLINFGASVLRVKKYLMTESSS